MSVVRDSKAPGAAYGAAASLVRCVKCGRANDAGLADCADCGAHLWVICQECEAKNRRADTECTRCGRRLRKALRTHARESRWSDGRLWVGLAVIAALLAAMAGLWVIFGRSHAPVAGAWAAGGALA